MFLRLRGDWRISQAAAVRSVLSDSAQRVWVADGAGGRAVGFVAATLHPDQELGEIHMIAVDPAAQRQGIGAALTTSPPSGCGARGCGWR